MKRYILPTLVLFSIVPGVSYAAVSIQEVAWMGDLDSSNNEWIELFNSGPAVAVDGWVLTDGVNLSIQLQGTIPSNTFAMLERTDDDSAPGTAFLIYAGALSNSGATLTLKDSLGTIIDRVSGGENWENIGGDNVTKHTAQRTQSGWITAPPTPGAANAEVGDAPQSDSDEENSHTPRMSSGSESSGGNTSISLVLPDTELLLALNAPRTAYVNQEVDFTVEPSGIGDALINSLTYTWNFGDGYAAGGKEASHVYRHPGTYVVAVNGVYARHDALARHTITVLPVLFSVARTETGDITVTNESSKEIDVSGFALRGDTDILFPKNTFLLPNTPLIIDRQRIENGPQKMVALYDMQKTLVASDVPTLYNPPAVQPRTFASKPTTQTSATKEKTATAETSEAPLVKESLSVAPEVGESQTAAVGSGGTPLASNRLAYFGLLGVLILAILALYSRRENVDS